MNLIEIFLPLADNMGVAFPRDLYRMEQEHLAKTFGGLTAFTRAPAEGIWGGEGDTGESHDEIVIFEIMTKILDREWWGTYRQALEAKFQQQHILIRVSAVEMI